jgi:pyruvate formate-lyase/glycerol dehydratase family glycyl radical enzyme
MMEETLKAERKEAAVETTDTGSPRGQRLLNRLLKNRKELHVSLWRARLLTASWKETEGLPTPIRRAKAFEKIVTEISMVIEDDQLLAGDFAAQPAWGEWYPEFGPRSILRDLESEEGRKAYREQGVDADEFLEMARYWNDRSVENAFFLYVKPEKYETWKNMGEENCYVVRHRALLDRLGGYHSINYEKVIKKGMLTIIAEIDDELAALTLHDDDSLRKINFLKAGKIVLEAAIRYAGRYAELASVMAEHAAEPRRSELLGMAEICRRIPALPARTFHEGVQAVWFVHALEYLETRSEGQSPGRIDQYLYPCFRSDMDAGRLTADQAIELLECLRVKISSLRQFSSRFFIEGMSGDAQFHNVTLGGQTPVGKDATNELSYLVMEAARRVRSLHPTLSIRVHDGSPEDFVLKGIEIAATGLGFPAFFNDNSNVPFLLSMGASPEESLDYAIGGCVVPVVPGAVGPGQPITFHLAKCMELALFDGFDLRTQTQVGPHTGKFEKFETFDRLVDAFKAQVEFFSQEAAEVITLQRLLREQLICPMFNDVLTDDCIKRGKSSLGDGARYRINYHNGRTMIDAVDSLAAVKKCVFDDRVIGKAELLRALQDNFEGREQVRKLLMAAPKYGNDDDYVDTIAVDLFKWWQEMCCTLDSAYGDKYMACAYSVGGHVPAGERTGALPNGRLAGRPLSDGAVSPSQGADTKGPTAVINSCCKIDQSKISATLLNMKFTASTLKTRDDHKKLFYLIKTYFDGGGKHIQFNTVDKATLLDAQVHPDRHPNLIVRVAGYSAYFAELSRGMQDEIIARTEHAL